MWQDLKLSRHRSLLWFSLFSLTVLLFVYPQKFEISGGQMEILSLLQQPSLFAIIFISWTALLIVLIFGITDSKVEPFLLIVAMSCIYLALWQVRSQWGITEEWATYGLSKSLDVRAPLGASSQVYLSFPGVTILIDVLRNISGLDFFGLRVAFLALVTMSIPIVLYTIFLVIVRQTRLALVGVFIALNSTAWPFIMHPSTVGILELLSALLIFSKVNAPTKSSAILTVALTSGVALNYLPASLYVLSVLACMSLVTRIITRFDVNKNVNRYWSFFLISALVTVAWLIYFGGDFAAGVFTSILGVISGQVPVQILNHYAATRVNSIVFSLPLWAEIIRIGWLGLSYVLSPLLVVFFYIKSREASQTAFMIGGLFGVIATTLAIVVLLPANFQGQRFLYYALVFSVPALLRLATVKGRIILLIAALLLISISWPTYLVQNQTVALDAWKSAEYGASNFISMYYPGSNIYVPGGSYWIYMGSLPNATYYTGLDFSSLTQPTQVFVDTESVLNSFQGSTNAIAILSIRVLYVAEWTWGISPTNSSWDGLFRPSDVSPLVFSNPMVVIYSSP